MINIIVETNDRGYCASVEGNPEMSEYGRTLPEAVGGLIEAHPRFFQIKVVLKKVEVE